MKRDTVFNLRVVGIGGEGIVKFSSQIADAAEMAGIEMSVIERPRSAMRLGPICCDFVFGQENFAAFIAPGDADVVLSVEPLDGLMNAAYYLKKNGLAILNKKGTETIVEILSGEKDKRSGEYTDAIKIFGGKIEEVDARGISVKEIGSEMGTNYYMLGILCAREKRFPIGAGYIRSVLGPQPDVLRCFEQGLLG